MPYKRERRVGRYLIVTICQIFIPPFYGLVANVLAIIPYLRVYVCIRVQVQYVYLGLFGRNYKTKKCVQYSIASIASEALKLFCFR